MSSVPPDTEARMCGDVAAAPVAQSAESYKVVDQKYHLKLRPDMYIGGIKPNTRKEIVFGYCEPEPAPEPEPTEGAEPAEPTSGASKRRARAKVSNWTVQTMDVEVAPGAVNCAREVLNNAYDNDTRIPAGQSWIKVTVGDTMPKPPADLIKLCSIELPTGPAITVSNNGAALPIVPYVTTKGSVELPKGTTVPEAILGNFLGSSAFDDTEVRAGGGKNGLGSKATIVFSNRYRIVNMDPSTGQSLTMEFGENMEHQAKTKITKRKAASGGLTASFVPDYERFGINDDAARLQYNQMVASLTIEMAALTPKSKVHLNGQVVPFDNIHKLAKLVSEKLIQPAYIDRECKLAQDASSLPADSPGHGFVPGVEFSICPRPTGMSEDMLPNLCYVNGIRCGGAGIEYIMNSIWTAIKPGMLKTLKRQKMTAPKAAMRAAWWLCIRLTIANPSFDSQTKDNLNTPTKEFGFSYKPSDKFIRAVKSKGVQSRLLEVLQHGVKLDTDSAISSLETAASRYSSTAGIPGYQPANNAGKKNRKQPTTLILCEGNSAANTATTIVSALGRDNYGILTLRGKVANLRKSPKLAATNKEYGYLKQIMQLRDGTTFADAAAVAALPYDFIMIMADQDHDGEHITGLCINIVSTQFPSLLKFRPNLFQRFITPIIRVRKGKRIIADFYAEAAYEFWKENEGKTHEPYKAKRYKGLGTSTREETIAYAASMDEHVLQLVYEEADWDEVELCFGKKVPPRRAHIESDDFNGNASLDYGRKEFTVTEYLQGAVWPYHWVSIQRGIPGIDGYKQVQRKALATFMAGRKAGSDKAGSIIPKDVKVDVAASTVALKMQYSYGQASLAAAIPLMAQNYIGCHNVAMLDPLGQFGTRVGAHSDHASPRYISTQCGRIARAVHPAEDDAVLKLAMEEGGPAEPLAYAQVVPLMLINGVELAISTAYSYSFPPHNPADVIRAVRSWMECYEDTEVREIRGMNPDVAAGIASTKPAKSDAYVEITDGLTPWWRWFEGSVVQDSASKTPKYTVSGTWDVLPGDKKGTINIRVTELPPGVWTNHWTDTIQEKFLIRKKSASTSSKSAKPFVRYLTNNSSDTKVDVTIVCDEAAFEDYGPKWSKDLGLVKDVHRKEIIVCDYERTLVFGTLSEFLDYFCNYRYQVYAKRVLSQLAEYAKDIGKASDRYRYVKAVVDGELVVAKRAKADVVADMVKMGFRTDEEAELNLKAGEGTAETPKFTRLLSMAMVSMTAEKLEELQLEIYNLEEAETELGSTTLFTLWDDDLQVLEDELVTYETMLKKMWTDAKTSKRRKTIEFARRRKK